jgi:DNA-directed RNA polymerase specialized sigma subunit
MRVLVDQLLDRCPPGEGAIMRLRFYEDMTQSELAESVSGSARCTSHESRLTRRCLDDLREILER